MKDALDTELDTESIWSFRFQKLDFVITNFVQLEHLNTI